jgi:hypothetical protein
MKLKGNMVLAILQCLTILSNVFTDRFLTKLDHLGNFLAGRSWISAGRTRQNSDKCFFECETLRKICGENFVGLVDRKLVIVTKKTLFANYR